MDWCAWVDEVMLHGPVLFARPHSFIHVHVSSNVEVYAIPQKERLQLMSGPPAARYCITRWVCQIFLRAECTIDRNMPHDYDPRHTPPVLVGLCVQYKIVA